MSNISGQARKLSPRDLLIKWKWSSKSWLVWKWWELAGMGGFLRGVGVLIGEKDSSAFSVWSHNFHLLSAYGRHFSHVCYHLVLTTDLWTEFYYPHFPDERSGLKRFRNLAHVTAGRWPGRALRRSSPHLSSQAEPKTYSPARSLEERERLCWIPLCDPTVVKTS